MKHVLKLKKNTLPVFSLSISLVTQADLSLVYEQSGWYKISHPYVIRLIHIPYGKYTKSRSLFANVYFNWIDYKQYITKWLNRELYVMQDAERIGRDLF